MMLRLDPPLPLETPKGKGWAHFVIDLGPEADLQWVVFLDKEFREDQPGGGFTVYHAGTCWTFQNREIKMQENLTLGRKRTVSFDDATAGAPAGGYCTIHGVHTGTHPCSWCEDERKAKPGPLVQEKPWTLIRQWAANPISARPPPHKPPPDARQQALDTGPRGPSLCDGLPETRPPAEHAKHEMHWLSAERASEPVPAQWVGGMWNSPGEACPIHATEMHRRGWRYYAPAYAPGWDYGERGNGGLREGGLYHLVRMGQPVPTGAKFVVVDAGDYTRWCIERKPA